MARDNISAKILIHLVSERPALWDKSSEDYKDRALKETSWREICTYINENYNSLEPKAKELFTRMIMKKWTHIRDCWVKSMKYGYDEVTKKPPKPYVYHNEMVFMQKILKYKPPRFNLSMIRLRNMHFEDFYREKNDTQYSNSNETSNELENNEDEETRSVGDINVENFKQEANSSNNESKVAVVNRADDVDDTDGWHLNDAHITAIVEEPSKKHTEPLSKKKRESIFISSHNEDEEEFEETKVEPSVLKKCMPPASSPTVRPIERSRPTYQRNNHSLEENRHWNFFKGILPSLDNLDEDHVLHFQSRVIVLIQKLRESQKQKSNKKSNRMCSHSLCKGRSRKRKFSCDDNDDDWATHNLTRRRRGTRQNSDPIAPENETDYSSDN